MRWPWRRHVNGEAEQAVRDAQDQLRAAHDKTPQVERTTRTAREVTRRTDSFAREVERTLRPRGT